MTEEEIKSIIAKQRAAGKSLLKIALTAAIDIAVQWLCSFAAGLVVIVMALLTFKFAILVWEALA